MLDKHNLLHVDCPILTCCRCELDLLAKEFYGDETLWYVIARANNLGKGSMYVPPGEIIRIPYEDAMGISEIMTEFNRSR